MNVKQGDLVTIDGVQSSVETSWGQGKHKIFKLKDGRTIVDLDKSVAAGDIKIDMPVDKKSPSLDKKWNL